MFNNNNSEKGQAIIIIVFAITGLLAITALAIDASHAYSDRRHAQSAADNSALAAALARANKENFQTAGLNLADSNGYHNDEVPDTVTVSNPPGLVCNGQKPTITLVDGENGSEDVIDNYVLVVIRSTVDTFFGPIIGVNQVHNCVEAVTRVMIYEPEPFAYGNAIAALDCKDSRAINDTGSSKTITINGGVFSNSDAEDGFYALKEDGLLIDPAFGGTAVGGFDLGFPQPSDWKDHQDVQIPCPLPNFWYPWYPNPVDFPIPTSVCTAANTYVNFPDPEFLEVVNGKHIYQLDDDTTYCIRGEFSQHANRDIYGSNVHFILLNHGLKWNGNAGFYLSAGVGDQDPLSGILIYLPKGNTSDITINGTADSVLSGTIFAPNSEVSLLGSYNGQSWQAQIIGRTIDLSGSSGLEIDYDRSLNGSFTRPSIFELVK